MFDGVGDGAVSSAFNLGKHWTLIGNWEFAEVSTGAAGFIKSGRYAIINTTDGAQTRINRETLAVAHNGVHSFNAVCSDGRLYGSNRQPYTDDVAQTELPSTGALYTGINAPTNYTSLRFKNLAVYEGAPLDEVQCKKAYDWLQTL